MRKIVLTQEIAEQFVGGLLAVARAGGEVVPGEGSAIDRAFRELVEDAVVDITDVMLLAVTPKSFARSIRNARGRGYRGPNVSSSQEIAQAFQVAARRVATEGDLTGHEIAVVQRYVTAIDP